eukprot:RCo013929
MAEPTTHLSPQASVPAGSVPSAAPPDPSYVVVCYAVMQGGTPGALPPPVAFFPPTFPASGLPGMGGFPASPSLAFPALLPPTAAAPPPPPPPSEERRVGEEG